MKKFSIKCIAILNGICLFATLTLTGQDLLVNAGFETGKLTPWFGDNDNVVTLVSDAHSADFAAVGNAAQNVSLEKDVEQELRCNGKNLFVTGNEKVWVWGQGTSSYSSDNWSLVVKGATVTSVNNQEAIDKIKV